MDPRVAFMKLSRSRPLTLSFVYTSILCIVSVIGILIEDHSRCKSNLTIWLVIVLVRSVLRLLLRLLCEGLSRYTEAGRAAQNNNMVVNNNNLQLTAKLIDILDIFGIVWFAVGNLVVFNSFGCVHQSPIVFFSCFFYIMLSYLHFLSPSLIRCSLRTCPPSSQEDLNYIRLIENTDNMAIMLRRNNNHFAPHGHTNLDFGINLELNDERSTYWTYWLQSYGCHEFRYHRSLDLAAAAASKDVEASAQEDLTTCAICLSAFEENIYEVTSSGAAGRPHHLRLSAQHSAAAASVDDDVKVNPVTVRAASVVEDKGGSSSSYDHHPNKVEQVTVDGHRHHHRGSSDSVDSIEAMRTSSSSNEVDNSIIVQYPCKGRHFFHSHCLKLWLHASSVQHQSSRYRMLPPSQLIANGIVIPGEIEIVTCPCCRELPSAVNNNHNNTSSSSNNSRMW